MDERIPIPQYFKGKKIFITGGTGFMGKVLIEKLLRSCPDVSNIYVLIRSKKGKSPAERIKQITDVALFDRIREENPDNFKKLIPIIGDVKELGLGLSQESRNILVDEVNILYHVAASVRFDDSLRDALIMNTRGTREVAYLAREMKHLEVLIHVSTAYTNTNRKTIGEEMYPPYADWREAIMLAERADEHTLAILTQKYMDGLPNTYIFSKNLAEHVIYDVCNGQIPAFIFRPSIVISTHQEPIPGWIDNLNGPVGILLACGKGILRSMYTDPSIFADYIPVDIVIKGLIIGTWLKGIEKDKKKKMELEVFNGSNNNINNITLKQTVDIGKTLSWDYPLQDIVWYPGGGATNCYPNHLIRVILFHLLPALFIDGLLKIAGKKPMLLRIQRKIYIANMALEYFVTQEWNIVNDKASTLDYKVVPSDQEAFTYGSRDTDILEFFINAIKGAKLYLLKEDPAKEARAKAHSRRMYVLYLICNCLWYLGVFYVAVFKLDIIGLFGQILDRFYMYFSSL